MQECTDQRDNLLEVRGIVKNFSGHRVLDDVDFDVRPGEVHALIGENGAGKSTLIKIIAGVYRSDQGEIFVDGDRKQILDPEDSQALGLAFIHQDLNIVPHLSVAENIFIGRYPCNRLGIVQLSRMVKEANEIKDGLKINANLKKPAGLLSVIEQWKIVINRALALNSRIIFMDEPTSSLTHSEVEELFRSISHLKETGKAIVYVSHRMEEVFRIADRITVIKDSKRVRTESANLMNPAKLYRMMLGRELNDVFPAKEEPGNRSCLKVKNLSRGDAVKDVNFHLFEGEILGIAGLVGSGRTELARLLFGADKKERGEIFIHDEKVNFRSPTDAIRCGVALVPEQRRSQGLVLPMDVKQNITLASLEKFLLQNGIPIINKKKEKSLSQKFFNLLKIKASGLNQNVGLLSGGNQQKVVLSKWLCSKAKILILDEPTKGMDVGAKFAIYKTITDLAGQGVGIIIISSDLTEVVGLSHRIIVMKQGSLKANLLRKEVDLPSILKLCLEEEDSITMSETI